MRYYFFIIILGLVVSCVPPSELNELDINIDLTNSTHQSIIQHKDARNAMALLPFLSSVDATERYLATEACASVQHDSLIAPLFKILIADPSREIRAKSAYALGQTRNQDILPELISAFQNQDTTSYNTPVRGAILEAIGKVGDQRTLDLISEISTYSVQDDHLLLGQARAIYRFGLRNLYSKKGTEAMIDRLTNIEIPNSTRLIAAQYLARNPGLDLSEGINRISAQLTSENNVDIRMALAATLTSRGNAEKAPLILSILSKDPDYRVQCNILRNLGSYDYAIYRDTIMNFLDSENDHLFNLSVALLEGNALREESAYFLNKARTEPSNTRKAAFLAVALNVLPAGYRNTRKIVSDEIVNSLAQVTNETDQAAFIKSLSMDPGNLPVLIESGLYSSSHLVRTTAINSLPTLMTNPRSLDEYSRPSTYAAFRETIVNELTKLLAQGDPGSVAAIANIIRNESCGFKDVVGLNLAVRSAMRKLMEPGDYEARKECYETLSFLEDTTYTVDPPPYNHPIQWSLLDGLSDSSRAYIITTKGQIEVKLYKNHAPGSVANFVSLAQSNFYDGKSIHRVVPNFVIQGGCSRGDGYGSLDYTIRSELGQMYYDAQGYIGMASAGKDTEGTQWFITHSPTPHLDARYTIFGKVTSGMDVVHNIQLGDLIQDVRILKY